MKDVNDFGGLVRLLPVVILGGSLALALGAALGALLCAKLLTPRGAKPVNADHILIQLGAANAVSACFGGITAGVNIGPSLTNCAFGATSSRSGLISAAICSLSPVLDFP